MLKSYPCNSINERLSQRGAGSASGIGKLCKGFSFSSCSLAGFVHFQMNVKRQFETQIILYISYPNPTPIDPDAGRPAGAILGAKIK